MTEDEARAIASKAVDEVLLRMGVDISTPGAVKDMQADFLFMRRSREAGESLKTNAIRTFFWVVGAALVSGFGWLMASIEWKGHP